MVGNLFDWASLDTLVHRRRGRESPGLAVRPATQLPRLKSKEISQTMSVVLTPAIVSATVLPPGNRQAESRRCPATTPIAPMALDDDDLDDDDDDDNDDDDDGFSEEEGDAPGFADDLDDDEELDEFDDIDEDDFDDDFDDDFEEELEDDYEIEIDDEISAEFGLGSEEEDEEIDDGLDDFDDFENIE